MVSSSLIQMQQSTTLLDLVSDFNVDWCYISSFWLVSLFHLLGKYFWLPLSFEVINLETIPIAYQLTPYSITFTHIHIYTDLWEAEFSASTYNLLVLLCTTDLTVNLPQSSYIPKAALNCLSRFLLLFHLIQV